MRHTNCTLAALLSVIFALACGGCHTGIKAGEVTSATSDVKGLRYFLPTPCLVIEQTADAKWDARLELMVDRSREFYVQPEAVFAKGTATIAFNDDGTLKSFKLDADSTAVASDTLATMKDLELERLKLEKEALDAKKKTDGQTNANALINAKPGKRMFAVYRIRGEEVVGQPAYAGTPFLERGISLQAASGQPEPEGVSDIPTNLAGVLTVKKAVSGSEYVIKHRDRNLTNADKAKLHFITNPATRAEKQIDASALRLENGVIKVEQSLLSDVKQVALVE
jgi:hypothetical protein